MTSTQERYVEARRAYEDAQRKADESFARYFSKLTSGEPTNAAQATRLSNEANYLSAELASAEISVWNEDPDADLDTIWKETN